jgi:hypothetical protein
MPPDLTAQRVGYLWAPFKTPVRNFSDSATPQPTASLLHRVARCFEGNPLAPGKYGAGGSGSRLKSTRTTLLSRAITCLSTTLSMGTPVFLRRANAAAIGAVRGLAAEQAAAVMQHAPITMSLACRSSVRSASMMSSKRTGAPRAFERRSGAASIAQASDAHDARTARF